MKTRALSLDVESSSETLNWEAVIPPYHQVSDGPSHAGSSHQYLSETLQGVTGRAGRFNPVLHQRTDRNVQLGVVIPSRAPGSDYRCVVSRDRSAKIILDKADPLLNGLSDSEWSALDAEALNFMLPSLSSGFSFLNFLWELRDFRRLWSAIMERKNILNTLVAGDDLKGKSFLRTAGSQPVSTLSKTYLNYSFAWRPFVQDIITMVKKLSSVEKELHGIWTRAGTPQTRHFKRQVFPAADDAPTFVWDSLVSQPISDFTAPFEENSLHLCSRSRWLEPGVYHATMRYSYKVPGALDHSQRIRGYLDAFGVRLDPSIIWNAIPFSFLLDWVVNVGGFLRRLSVDNLKLETVIEDFCSSWKSEIAVDYALQHRHSTNEALWGRHSMIGNVKRKIYERRTVIPNLFAALSTSSLTSKEMTLGSALIGSRKRF